MIIDILESNEKAYSERYGVSLRGMLKHALECNGISDEAVAFYNDYFRRSAEQSTRFDPSICSGKLLWLLCGFADGTYVRRLLDNLPEASKILLYEPDEASFLYCCCINDVADIIKMDSLCLIVYDEIKTDLLYETLQKEISLLNYDHMGSLVAPGYESFYNEIYNSMLKTVKSIATDTSNDVANILRFKEDTCRNELFSLSQISDNYLVEDFIHNIPTREVPLIIVAAGPSLKKNAAALEYAKGKSLIIAVSHAAKKLDDEGIIPDFIAVSDPHPGADFMQHDQGRKNRLIVSSAANRKNQADYNGKLFYHSFSKETFPYDFVQRMGDEISTGSVATDIFKIFLDAGFTKFILVGQDLAYGENGETHATGNTSEQPQNNEIWVKGISGREIRTRQDWLGFKTYYEEQILSHPEITVIDATEGGAYIEGSECMSLIQAIKKFCISEYDFTDCCRSLPHAISNEEEEYIKKDLLNCTDKIDLFREKSEKAVELNLKIQGVILGIYEKEADFAENCASYDRLYHELLDDRSVPLIFRYMSESLARYNKNALVYEQNQDIYGRLKEELELFKAFQEKLPELKEFIKYLMTES